MNKKVKVLIYALEIACLVATCYLFLFSLTPTILSKIPPDKYQFMIELTHQGWAANYNTAIFCIVLGVCGFPLLYLLLLVHRWDKREALKRLRKELMEKEGLPGYSE